MKLANICGWDFLIIKKGGNNNKNVESQRLSFKISLPVFLLHDRKVGAALNLLRQGGTSWCKIPVFQLLRLELTLVI